MVEPKRRLGKPLTKKKVAGLESILYRGNFLKKYDYALQLGTLFQFFQFVSAFSRNLLVTGWFSRHKAWTLIRGHSNTSIIFNKTTRYPGVNLNCVGKGKNKII